MMRLTLRTLLAYLDDVLSPADTKLIGQKIQESPMAQLLVSRIREVMRRRRLKAPEVFGPEMGIDPNVVAQYLDNTLPIEQYADVERVLLSSDELLAETASCHQVLTVILGESREVPLASRERLYALGPVESSSKLSIGSDTSHGVTSKTPESVSTISGKSGVINTHDAASKTSGHPVEHVTAVPDYLKPTPIWKQLVPAAFVIALLGVCIALAYPLLNEGLEQARTEMNQKKSRPSSAATGDSATVPGGDEPAGEPTDATADRVASNNVAEKVPQAEPDTDLELPPARTTDTPKRSTEVGSKSPLEELHDLPTPTPPAATGVPASATDVAVNPPKPNVAEPPSNNVPPAPQLNEGLPDEVLADLKIGYTSLDGVLAKLNPERGRWFVVPKSSEVNLAERLANLEPFEGILEFDKAGVKATLINECVVETLPPNPAGLQGLGISRGRVILQSLLSTGAERSSFAIAIGQDLWKLELLSDDAACAIEVAANKPVQFEKVNTVRWYEASIVGLAGSVKLTMRSGRAVELAELNAFELAPEKGEVARSEPYTMSAPPDWTFAAKRKNSPMRNYQAQFEKSFDPKLSVEDSMLTLVTEAKNPKMAELGAKGLSATDDYSAMVQTLVECPHQEGQLAAFEGLRQWLPMNPENGPRLKAALLTHYQNDDAEAAYRMLWGFTLEEVQSSKSGALRFVTWMRSQRPEIRKLAVYCIDNLTKRKYEFNAYGNEKQRDSQIRRIEEQIEKNGGLKSFEKSSGAKKGS